LGAKIIQFPNKNQYDSERVTLFDWVNRHHSEDSMREVFLNMDIALKYIHDHGYCIEVFYPTNIEILNNNPDYVLFDSLLELPNDQIERKNMIKEDIFNSSLIQIGLYTNTMRSLTPEFLRENFDEIARFVPEGDVPYYRGVVQRGASVYFNEYALEKMNRDLEQLEKQIAESDGDKSVIKEKHYENEPLTNNRINDSIYKQINGLKDVAFISYLLIPTLILVTLFILSFISWVLSLF
jgi:hypothetical protein